MSVLQLLAHVQTTLSVKTRKVPLPVFANMASPPLLASVKVSFSKHVGLLLLLAAVGVCLFISEQIKFKKNNKWATSFESDDKSRHGCRAEKNRHYFPSRNW